LAFSPARKQALQDIPKHILPHGNFLKRAVLTALVQLFFQPGGHRPFGIDKGERLIEESLAVRAMELSSCQMQKNLFTKEPRMANNTRLFLIHGSAFSRQTGQTGCSNRACP
jgi:hypothetical protein